MEPAQARRKATELLARREFSRAELAARLTARGTEPAAVETILDELAACGAQSDTRFCESFVRERARRGHGPLRLRAELGRRGVDEDLVAQALEEAGVDWVALAREARRKRFGVALPQDFPERARQMRFLQFRGFDADHIRSACGDDDEP